MYSKMILIVDDEPRAREGIKRTLEVWSEGRYHILSAEGGEEALSVMEKHRVQLLITDIRMPEITGLRLVGMIKSMNSKPVVIVISAYPEFQYAQEAIQMGVLNYLLKPINKKKLIQAVEEALKVYDSQEKVELMEKVIDPSLTEISKNHHISSTIKGALVYVDNNIQSPLSLQKVADYVHLNSSYFSVLFKEQTQMTFSEYITRSRIQISKNLLVSTELSIEEIASNVGYHTAKYFNKLFKVHEGITPSQFRKQALAD